MKIGNIDLEWKGHAGFFIKSRKVICIDPYQLSRIEKADIILITHSHYDHCSIQDIEKVVQDGTVIVMPPDCQSKIGRIKKEIQMQVMEPGDEIEIKGVRVKAVPAYNLNKQFHPKDEYWLGYLIKIGEITIYHAGDTDLVPEMKDLPENIIALLPVGGNYTMDYKEAAKAASAIKASLAIPMHYGSIVGEKKDAEKFCELVKKDGIKCQILEKN